MILLWGLPNDPPISAVYTALQRAKAPVMFLDQQAVLTSAIELHVGQDITGILAVGNEQLDLATITAVYLRPHDARRLPALAHARSESLVWQHVVQFEDVLFSWIDLTAALVVNTPGAMAANNSKPYQIAQIQGGWFALPETLITTDPLAAEAFWERHGTVVYKSISGTRSIVSQLTHEHRARFDDIRWCPTQFQQYVPGNDYRVHVVKDSAFACEIISDADDYRYSAQQGRSTTIRPYELPSDCAEQCRLLAARLDLHVAGIDLRRTPDGQWFCFEVNPSPGFTYYQEATGHPIDLAIANLLTQGS